MFWRSMLPQSGNTVRRAIHQGKDRENAMCYVYFTWQFACVEFSLREEIERQADRFLVEQRGNKT